LYFKAFSALLVEMNFAVSREKRKSLIPIEPDVYDFALFFQGDFGAKIGRK